MANVARQGLKQAHGDLNYLQPLQYGDRRLALDLFEPALEALAEELLLIRGEPRRLLLHGHVGSGKSTFLNCLQVRPSLQASRPPTSWSRSTSGT